MKRFISTFFVCLCVVASASAQIGIAVDLGLPSGTKWASCNVGASQPEEYGDYFAWGETEVKAWYSNAPYRWYVLGDGSGLYNGHYTKYYVSRSSGGFVDGLSELEAQDDVASVRWGKEWRIPTTADVEELVKLCTWEWTKVNDVKGYSVTGPNGNSIFMPAAGVRVDYDLKYDKIEGHYWTRSLAKESYWGNNIDYLYFDKRDKAKKNRDRFSGLPVRPVTKD